MTDSKALRAGWHLPGLRPGTRCGKEERGPEETQEKEIISSRQKGASNHSGRWSNSDILSRVHHRDTGRDTRAGVRAGVSQGFVLLHGSSISQTRRARIRAPE